MHFKIIKRYGGQAGWSLQKYEAKKVSYVPVPHWPDGLRKEMTVEQAREYIKLLNSSSRIAGEEGQRLRATQRLKRRDEIEHALLPDVAVATYEKNNILWLPVGDPTRKKRENVWETAKLMVQDLAMHPGDWSQSSEPIYLYGTKKRWSWDFFKRVVSAANRYGRIYCRMMGQFFEPIEVKDQRRKIDIETAFGDGQESSPLPFDRLLAIKKDESIPIERRNWIWICFWFGLRPHETDLMLLKKAADGEKTWWLEDNEKTLVVYQPKLTKVKPKKRYKRIPILRAEQEEALTILKSRNFERPTDKQASKWFPANVSLYGCRHGFAVLMDKDGADIYAISRWMGHQSVTTTERHYVRLGLRKDTK